MVSKTFVYVERVLINLLKNWFRKLGNDIWPVEFLDTDVVLERSKNRMSIILLLTHFQVSYSCEMSSLILSIIVKTVN